MSDEASTPVVSEKWADLIRLFSGDPDAPHELGPGEYGPLPEAYGVADLLKTEAEERAIEEVVAGLNELRRILLGQAPLAFPAARVHIVTPDEFRAKVAPRRFHGKSMYGHVYLWRGWDVVDLQAILAHEMVHAVSYLWLDLHSDGAEAWPGERWRTVTVRRIGLALIDPSYGTWLPHFHGFNECVTETLAMMVRRLVAGRSSVLDDEEKKRLAAWVSSPPLVRFADALVIAASGESGDSVETWRVLTHDIMMGTDGFLKTLEAKLPGATEILRRTGATPPELLIAAKKLGLDELADFIDGYC